MTSWILVYSFLVPGNMHFNQPVIMDHYTTQSQCETSLNYIVTQYKEANIVGRGYDPKTVKVTKLMKIAAAHIVDKHARGRLTRSYVQVLEEQSRDRGARTKK